MQSNKKRRKKKGRHITRFPGICADARALGVSRIHLYYVLMGQRHSKSLTRRYRDLQRQKKENPC
jgi:hypothetical protein